MTDNVTDFPGSKRDLIAEMLGPVFSGRNVIIDGRHIPNVAMIDHGAEIEFILDGRLSYSFPRDIAWLAMAFAANAMAIGAGYPSASGGLHQSQREFATPVMELPR